MGKKRNKCAKCKKIIKEVPFTCRYCGKDFCLKHRLPENHDCKPFREHESHNQERWQNIIKSVFHRENRYIKKSKIPDKKKNTNKIKTETIPDKKMSHPDKEEEFNLKKWANHREKRKYSFQEKFNYLISLSLKFVFSLVVFAIACTKLENLNQIKILFIQFGGIIFLVSLYFLLRFSYDIVKELYDLFERQKNGIKFLVVFILVIILLFLYFFKESIVDALVNLYNQTHFSDISPFAF